MSEISSSEICGRAVESLNRVEVEMERARMLLSEMGWTDPRLVARTESTPLGWWVIDAVPWGLCWTVYRRMGLLKGCWYCWSTFIKAHHQTGRYDTPEGDDVTACHGGSCPHPEQPKNPPPDHIRSPQISLNFGRRRVTEGVSHGGVTHLTKLMEMVENGE